MSDTRGRRTDVKIDNSSVSRALGLANNLLDVSGTQRERREELAEERHSLWWDEVTAEKSSQVSQFFR